MSLPTDHLFWACLLLKLDFTELRKRKDAGTISSSEISQCVKRERHRRRHIRSSRAQMILTPNKA